MRRSRSSCCKDELLLFLPGAQGLPLRFQGTNPHSLVLHSKTSLTWQDKKNIQAVQTLRDSVIASSLFTITALMLSSALARDELSNCNDCDHR
jgi:hypothetical protein